MNDIRKNELLHEFGLVKFIDANEKIFSYLRQGHNRYEYKDGLKLIKQYPTLKDYLMISNGQSDFVLYDFKFKIHEDINFMNHEQFVKSFLENDEYFDNLNDNEKFLLIPRKYAEMVYLLNENKFDIVDKKKILLTIYKDSEGGLSRKFMNKLIDILEQYKSSSLNENKQLQIYRGINEHSIIKENSLSWTTDYDVAKMFAKRFSQNYNTQKILSTKINTNDVLHIFDDDNEYEVLVQYDKIDKSKLKSENLYN